MEAKKHTEMFLLFLVSLCFFYGCLSQIAPIESSKKWIGLPIIRIEKMVHDPGSYPKSIGWQDITYLLANGNSIYIEPVRPDCFIHWEVNQQGIIIGYKTVGTRCY